MRVLRARLLEHQLAEQQAEEAAERKAQVGSGERSEKIRTYNFPQDRITDHRVKVTANGIERVLGGELDEFTEALAAEEKRSGSRPRRRRRRAEAWPLRPSRRSGSCIRRRRPLRAQRTEHQSWRASDRGRFGARRSARRSRAPSMRSAAAGVDSPRLDAELLLAEATGWAASVLAADPDEPLPSGASREFAADGPPARRREPVAYILGRKGFRGIELEVDPRVLIPRPETELLVEIAVELAPASVLDVGTGSGAVALAVADELPDAEVTATDTPRTRWRWPRENAAGWGCGPGRVRHGHAARGDRAASTCCSRTCHTSSEGEWEELAPEIREYEPRTRWCRARRA